MHKKSLVTISAKVNSVQEFAKLNPDMVNICIISK